MKHIALMIVSACFVSASVSSAQSPDQPSAPEARSALHDFGRCVVQRSRSQAARVLQMDVTTGRYDRALTSLAVSNGQYCAGEGTSMRSADLLMAGSIAEALLANDSAALNVRIIRAAAVETEPFSHTDRIATCVVRSVPDDVHGLLATEVASPAEASAVAALAPAARLCAGAGATLSTNDEGLRALLATAAYRLIAAAEAPSGSD